MNTRMHPVRSSFKPAFTLIEVLITITIIVVLAAISFIALRKVKESASAAVDAGDMRTISAAVIMYAADNNDLLPITSGGVSPVYRKKSRDLCSELIEYFGRDETIEGDFLPEFAAASWQSAKTGENGPSMLVMHNAYSGTGKPANISKPDPYIQPFGYPYSPGNRAPMRLTGALSKMSNPSTSLMLIEIDRLVPGLGNPGWISTVPEKMAHGSYRLGLFWDGHVSKLNVDLEPL